MKNFILYSTAILFVFFFNSCSDNSPVGVDIKTRGELVSGTLAKEYTPQDINALGIPFTIPNNVKVYKIVFKTIDGNNKEIQASGVVIIPQKSDSMSVLFHSHGSAFTKSEGAASELGNSIKEALLISGAGYVSFFPDYLGFGASKDMFHPYHIQKYYATSGVDFIKAAKKFCSDNATKLNNKFFIMGYSEGGYSTLALQKEIEKNYSTEIKITAVASGAAASSLTETSKTFSTSAKLAYPAYVLYIYKAYKTYYTLSYTANQIFNEPYASKVDSLLDGTKTGGQINSAITDSTAKLFTANFISTYNGSGFTELKNLFAENDLIDWKPIAPLRLFHGIKDITVPYKNSEMAYNSFKSKGSNVTLVTYSTGAADHGGSALPWFFDTLTWLGTF